MGDEGATLKTGCLPRAWRPPPSVIRLFYRGFLPRNQPFSSLPAAHGPSDCVTLESRPAHTAAAPFARRVFRAVSRLRVPDPPRANPAAYNERPSPRLRSAFHFSGGPRHGEFPIPRGGMRPGDDSHCEEGRSPTKQSLPCAGLLRSIRQKAGRTPLAMTCHRQTLFGASGGEPMTARSMATGVDRPAEAGKASLDLPTVINAWLGGQGVAIAVVGAGVRRPLRPEP